jgi:DNA-binding winged helix-turn-helix (wHTH) protein
MFRFGKFELCDETYELRRDGEPVSAEKKPIDIVLTLVRQRDRVVSRAELLSAVWPGVSVGPRVVDTAVYVARKTLGDDPDSPTMIKTVRGRGYRWIAPIVESRDVAQGGRTPLGADVPILGRNAEVVTFENALSLAASGSGSCLVFTGEPGIGKSRLLEELSSIATRLQAVVARSHCSPIPGMPALWPVRQILSALETSGDPGLEVVAPRCPELSVLLNGRTTSDFSTDRAPEDQKATQLQTFASLATYVGNSMVPVVVLVDDVQWADQTSMHVLSLLAEWARRLPLVLVMAGRDGLSSDGAGNLDLLQSASTRMSRLEPLGLAEVRDYLSTVWRRDPATDEVSRFERLSGGNPLFLSLSFSCSSSDLPESVRAAALRHAGQLDVASLEAVRDCAAAGNRVDIELMAEVMAVSTAELLETLAPSLQSGLMRSEGSRAVRFRHSLVRDVLYEELSVPRRRALHARLGLALLERIKQGRSECWDEAGFHLATSGDTSLGRSAVFCLGVAASVAYQCLALEDAVSRAETALDLADGSLPVPDEMVCNLMLVRGSALAALGSGQAIEELRRALSIAISLERPDMIARVAFAVAPGLLSVQAGVWDPLTAGLLEEALRALPSGETEWTPLVEARLAQSLYWGPGTGSQRESLVASALKGVESSSDGFRESLVRASSSAALYSPESLGDRLAVPRPQLGENASALEVDTAFLLGMIRISSFLESGDADGVERELGWFAATLERWPSTPAKWYLGLYEAMVLLQRGELDGALESVRRAAVLGESVGDANAGLAVGAIALSVRYLRGEFGGLDDLIGDFAARFPRIPHWRGPQVLFRLKSGDVDGATSLASVVVAESRQWPRNATWLAGVGLLAEAVAELGVEAWSTELVDLLAPFAGRLCVVGYGVSTWGTVDRILGRLELGLRRPAEAVAHFESAVKIEGNARLRPWKALSMGSLALALRARGRARDLEKAEHARAESQMLAKEFGMSLSAVRWSGTR